LPNIDSLVDLVSSGRRSLANGSTVFSSSPDLTPLRVFSFFFAALSKIFIRPFFIAVILQATAAQEQPAAPRAVDAGPLGAAEAAGQLVASGGGDDSPSSGDAAAGIPAVDRVLRNRRALRTCKSPYGGETLDWFLPSMCFKNAGTKCVNGYIVDSTFDLLTGQAIATTTWKIKVLNKKTCKARVSWATLLGGRFFKGSYVVKSFRLGKGAMRFSKTPAKNGVPAGVVLKNCRLSRTWRRTASACAQVPK